MKKPIVIIAILIAFCLLWAFVKTDNPTAQAPQAAAQPVNVMTDDEKRESENARKIAEAQNDADLKKAVIPIDKTNYPSVYANWGDDGIKTINQLMLDVGKRVQKEKECDKLEYVGYSDRSIVPTEPIVFADCQNGTRYFVSKTTMDKNYPLTPRKR